MEVESAPPEAQQPVKQVPDVPEAIEEPELANGIHAEDPIPSATDELAAEQQEAEASAQTAVEVPEPPSEPAVESADAAEEQDAADAVPEVEADAAKLAKQPSQPEPESAPAAAVPREELPIWRKRQVLRNLCCAVRCPNSSEPCHGICVET